MTPFCRLCGGRGVFPCGLGRGFDALSVPEAWARAGVWGVVCCSLVWMCGDGAAVGGGVAGGGGVVSFGGGRAVVALCEWGEMVGRRAVELGLRGACGGGLVDVVYVDPPFGTGGAGVGGAGRYEDGLRDLDGYAAWIGERLGATRGVLRETGGVLVHVDWRASHRVRVVLDEVFGADRFVNHLVWRYGLGGSSARRFSRKHDDILWYCVDPSRYWFEAPMVPATSARMRGRLKKATDVLDVPALNNMARERVGYPTQKPLALLEMLIGAVCPPGGLVADPCGGSGTAGVAAVNLGRRCVVGDVSADAFGVMSARLSEACA